MIYVVKINLSRNSLFATLLLPTQGFLHIDEYPPDANQGFDIPSAVVSFPDFQASLHFLRNDTLDKSPMISKLQVIKSGNFIIYVHF